MRFIKFTRHYSRLFTWRSTNSSIPLTYCSFLSSLFLRIFFTISLSLTWVSSVSFGFYPSYTAGAYKNATDDQIELIDLQRIFESRSQKSFIDLTLTGDPYCEKSCTPIRLFTTPASTILPPPMLLFALYFHAKTHLLFLLYISPAWFHANKNARLSFCEISVIKHFSHSMMELLSLYSYNIRSFHPP